MGMIIANESGALICPIGGRCEGMHHSGVKVFDRNEDEDTGLFVHVREQTVQVATKIPEGNPSLRRGGLVLGFWCELCGGSAELCIAQHKGWTYVAWRNLDKNGAPIPS